ncbi:MAG: 50S ribosomal protein L6 [Proteobacteria bacterium]|jgi:large subunit ribosomal protein L6|nr:50S ribosomal protein L6 [Pseudomonadota bacterium]
MSKIARLPISLPQQVQLSISTDKRFIDISSKGISLSYPFHSSVEIVQKDGTVSFETNSTLRNRTVKSIIGTVYASVKGAINDIQNKFAVKIQLKGVGYKAVFTNKILTLSLGFSHPVKIAVPDTIEVKITQNTLIELFGFDRRTVMDLATTIRNLRKPEPYKGKGIFINDETITIKEGKKK